MLISAMDMLFSTYNSMLKTTQERNYNKRIIKRIIFFYYGHNGTTTDEESPHHVEICSASGYFPKSYSGKNNIKSFWMVVCKKLILS